MTVNINIKANVENLTLSEIHELIIVYRNTFNEKSVIDNFHIIDFKNLKFKIEVEFDLGINYIINEIDG